MRTSWSDLFMNSCVSACDADTNRIYVPYKYVGSLGYQTDLHFYPLVLYVLLLKNFCEFY